MNTMYAAVAYRTREIGTLRALGFSRFAHRLGVPGRVDRAGGRRRHHRLPAGAAGARPVHRRDEHDQLQRTGVQVPDHAGAARQRPDFFRGDGSGRRPAAGDSRGQDPCRPRPARDLAVLPNIVQITIFWVVQASALLVFTVPFRWPLVGAVGGVALPARRRADAAVPPLPGAPRVQDEPGRALRLGLHRHRGDAEGSAVVGRAPRQPPQVRRPRRRSAQPDGQRLLLRAHRLVPARHASTTSSRRATR